MIIEIMGKNEQLFIYIYSPIYRVEIVISTTECITKVRKLKEATES